jgi:hypothetical protein
VIQVIEPIAFGPEACVRAVEQARTHEGRAMKVADILIASSRLGLALALVMALQAAGTTLGAESAQQNPGKPSESAKPDRKEQDQPAIGVAWMEEDGTIVVELFRTGDGKYAHGLFHYRKSDSDYQKILDHIGPMRPGEKKPVTPWPD